MLPGRAVKGNTPSPADAYVYIGWPNNGEVINASRLPDGRFRVWFGLRNMGVAPAGVNVPNTGHHHLLIDVELPPLDQEIPSDKNHLHFGHGQTETVLAIARGDTRCSYFSATRTISRTSRRSTRK